jgi:SAM-dependent methyltransferase
LGEVYDSPRYYEIAFAFRDIKAEVDLFEEVIRRHSRIPVSSMLELGCGPATHLSELSRRGYRYIGLDLSPAMLTAAAARAAAAQAPATFLRANMCDFHLESPVDFAFVLLGSLFATCTADLFAHFDAVGRALKPGGLYFLDWCINFSTNADRSETWTITDAATTVATTYSARVINPIEQTFEEVITLNVLDAGKSMTLREAHLRREIFPQEFLIFLRQQSDFEFIGWWNNWDLTRPLDGGQKIGRPITLLRRV